MFKRLDKISYEQLDDALHPEYETRNTRVSEYLRKYGQGKIDTLPTDNRPTVQDDRSTDEMLQDGFEPSLGTEQLDVLLEFEAKKEDFMKMQEDIEMTQKDKESFDAAVKIINDANSSQQDKFNAYEVLEELQKKCKVIRARK